MKLPLKAQYERLRHRHTNRALIEAGQEPRDFEPVVKLFTPDASCTRLLTELDPEDPDIAFGQCDLGMGTPEIGRVSLTELASVRGPLGLHVGRDRYFAADRTLSVYADEARARGYVAA